MTETKSVRYLGEMLRQANSKTFVENILRLSWEIRKKTNERTYIPCRVERYNMFTDGNT